MSIFFLFEIEKDSTMCKPNSKTTKLAACANCSGCKLAAATVTLSVAADKTVSSSLNDKQGADGSDKKEPSAR
ncbi:MAG: hypothetical protein IAF58_19925 [Leptolyngbya sp.]|nr:hypothetical protein [Candidatus Melainabacteria bacterium]